MPVLHFILGPAVGALIGGLTNKVAIRMLFRPHRAVYIGRFHVPFTPGIIPKEKPRIAAAIGDAVGNELLNSDVLSQTLLSDEMYAKISNSVNSLVDRMMVDTTPLRDVIARYAAPEETDRLLETVLLALSNGQSVRACTLEMADGDTRRMLRYQNKYRALLKSQPDRVRAARKSLIEHGHPVPDPFVRDPDAPRVGRPPKATNELETRIRALLENLLSSLLALTQGENAG